jgi:hypothetical protein
VVDPGQAKTRQLPQGQIDVKRLFQRLEIAADQLAAKHLAESRDAVTRRQGI